MKYKIKSIPIPDRFCEQQKAYELKNLKFESARSKHGAILELVSEVQPMIGVIRTLATSHEPVKWEDLPLSGGYCKTYIIRPTDAPQNNAPQSTSFVFVDDYPDYFKVVKLWASFNERELCFNLKIITSRPSGRGILPIQTHQLGKLYVSHDGKSLKSYCSHCDNFKFE